MKEPKFYAGDLEIAITSFFLGININILIKDAYYYKSINYYNSPLQTD